MCEGFVACDIFCHHDEDEIGLARDTIEMRYLPIFTRFTLECINLIKPITFQFYRHDGSYAQAERFWVKNCDLAFDHTRVPQRPNPSLH